MIGTAIVLLCITTSPPGDAASHWERGEVFHRGAWRHAAAVEPAPENREFVERRRKTRETGESHWDLAKWAKKHGAAEEFRAHAVIAERLGFTSPDMHKTLGRKLKDGEWGTAAEFAARAKLLEERRAIDREWTKQLAGLPVPPKRIPSIADPRAIPTFEREVSARSDGGARLVVEQLRGMTHQAATSSLARHAVFGPGEGSRSAAAAALLERPADAFVPFMLDWLSPLVVDSGPGINGAPTWFWRDYDRTSFAEARIRSIRTSASLGGVQGSGRSLVAAGAASDDRRVPAESTWTTLAEIHKRAVGDKIEAALSATEARALRTRGVLSTVARKDLGDDPAVWRKWWTEAGGAFFDADAPAAPLPAVDESTSVDAVAIIQSSNVGQPGTMLGECFRFDTPVWTERGLRPIHKIELGDRVLSRDVRSGELAFKPVIYRTLLPRSAMQALSVGEEVVHATGSHAFWADGRGWVKARDLKPGATLRTYDGKTRVVPGKEGPSERAFNLEVAEFGTFFVGKAGVLVHDLSPIRD
ncbi:MAG TPA: polymorphic toxin-type HINT domain-containing protein [Planctomycetia bacterium]|nr:polymorphic toxin-type HINT domain-containing protein [Planctomycetia bacterium]